MITIPTKKKLTDSKSNKDLEDLHAKLTKSQNKLSKDQDNLKGTVKETKDMLEQLIEIFRKASESSLIEEKLSVIIDQNKQIYDMFYYVFGKQIVEDNNASQPVNNTHVGSQSVDVEKSNSPVQNSNNAVTKTDSSNDLILKTMEQTQQLIAQINQNQQVLQNALSQNQQTNPENLQSQPQPNPQNQSEPVAQNNVQPADGTPVVPNPQNQSEPVAQNNVNFEFPDYNEMNKNTAQPQSDAAPVPLNNPPNVGGDVQINAQPTAPPSPPPPGGQPGSAPSQEPQQQPGQPMPPPVANAPPPLDDGSAKKKGLFGGLMGK